MAIKPIKPSEIAEGKASVIPDYVFDVFNREISKAYADGRSVVVQNAVVDALVKRGHDRNAVFNCGWLNVEESYRAAGWDVEYDKPGYNESGEAKFTFTPLRAGTEVKR